MEMGVKMGVRRNLVDILLSVFITYFSSYIMIEKVNPIYIYFHLLSLSPPYGVYTSTRYAPPHPHRRYVTVGMSP